MLQLWEPPAIPWNHHTEPRHQDGAGPFRWGSGARARHSSRRHVTGPAGIALLPPPAANRHRPHGGTEHGSAPAQKPGRQGCVSPPRREGRAGTLQRLRAAGQRRPGLHKPGPATEGTAGHRDGGRAAARPAGGRIPPPTPPNRPPHSFPAASSYVRKERTSWTRPERRCAGIKVQIMATTTPFGERQLPPGRPYPGRGCGSSFPPSRALTRCIRGGRAAGRSGEGRAPSPARTGPTVPFHRAEFCPGGAQRGQSLPRLSPLHRGRPRAGGTGGTLSPSPLTAAPRPAGLSPGRGPSGAMAAPRGRSELGATPPGPRPGSRGAPRPAASRSASPRGLRTHPRRSGSSRS